MAVDNRGETVKPEADEHLEVAAGEKEHERSVAAAREGDGDTDRDGAEPVGRPGLSTRERRAFLAEILSTTLLAAATLGTAWSGYQASQWGGIQTDDYTEASAMRLESLRASSEANLDTNLDVEMFEQWVDATLDGQDELAAFYENRFRSELQPAFEAWKATDPFNNTDAPRSPFVMPQYKIAALERSRQLTVDADALFKSGHAADDIGDQYIFNTVILASVLFLAGLESRFLWTRVRLSVNLLAMGLLVIGMYYLMVLPKA